MEKSAIRRKAEEVQQLTRELLDLARAEAVLREAENAQADEATASAGG